MPTYRPWRHVRRPPTARRRRPRPRPGRAGTAATLRFLTPTGSPLAGRDPGEPALADVLAVRADQPVVRVLLDHVRRPPRHPAHREDAGEKVGRNPQVVIDGGGVEVDVGQQALLLCDDLFHPPGHAVEGVVAGL